MSVVSQSLPYILISENVRYGWWAQPVNAGIPPESPTYRDSRGS